MSGVARAGFAVAAVCGIAAFAALGTWQWQRGVAKQHLLAETAELLETRDAKPLATQLSGDARQMQWTRGHGSFDARGPLLLDNQMRAGRAGVRVYRLFDVEGNDTPLLVDLGWLPLPADRTLPPIATPLGRLSVEGLLIAPPSAGIAMGEALAPGGEGWLMTRVDMAAITHALQLARPPSARVLRLDPALPLGYERDLDVLTNTLPPERHRGYAVQWWGLAATVLVLWLLLGFRRKRT